MKKLKMLALAVVAVAAMTATAGAGTASATVTTLCEIETTVGGMPVCPAGNQYKVGTVLHAQLEQNTKLVLETTIGKVECSESTLKATTELQTAKPLGAAVNVLTFGNCGEYTVAVIMNGTLDIEVIDLPFWTHHGTLTFTGTKIEVKKGTKECEYFAGHAGTLTGGATATIDLSGTLTRFEGVECPAGNGTWKGAYTVTAPKQLWVSQ